MSNPRNELNVIFYHFENAAALHSAITSIRVNYRASVDDVKVESSIKQMKIILMDKAVEEIEKCRNRELQFALDFLKKYESKHGALI